MGNSTSIFPHGDIEEIGTDIFMLRGSIKMNAIVRFTRNMAIVRSGSELSLLNPVRMNEKGEKQLEALGKVTNVIRLGPFHGVDDPYYVEKYGAQMWAQEGGLVYIEPSIDTIITAATELPFNDAEIFEFNGLKQPECALLLKASGGLLLTCDAIQNYGNYSYNSIPARILMPFIGFPKTTLIGPIWLKMLTPEGGDLESEFRRLLQLDFDRLLSSHGTLLESGAHSAVERAIKKAFAKKG
jgi:hypothetical protein